MYPKVYCSIKMESNKELMHDESLKAIHTAFPTIDNPCIAYINEKPFKYDYTGYKLVTILKLDMCVVASFGSRSDDNIKVYKNGNKYLFHRDKAYREYVMHCPSIDTIAINVKTPVTDISTYHGFNLFKLHEKDLYFVVDVSKINTVIETTSYINSRTRMAINAGNVVIVDNPNPQGNAYDDISYIISRVNPLDYYHLFESEEDLIKALRRTELVYNCWNCATSFEANDIPFSNISEPNEIEKLTRYYWIKLMYAHAHKEYLDQCK